MTKRVFLIVADSLGVGECEDSALFGDVGSDTLRSIYKSGRLHTPFLRRLGLFNIDGLDYGHKAQAPLGSFAKMAELSAGKDTTVGHFEIAGLIMREKFPTYPNGFGDDILSVFKEKTGKEVLCNKPYSGTAAIADYGREHIKTGALIVYTSADSVFQIAAHTSVVPVEQLYAYCMTARSILTGKNGVARVIARPFEGEYPYIRTADRHDFSLKPPKDTMLDLLKQSGKEVISIGKINDIFASRGITEHRSTVSNDDGADALMTFQEKDFSGLCFANLVDFDMKYGHRNDAVGYAEALNRLDGQLLHFHSRMKNGDVMIFTADHGCDPATPSFDHSREYTPMLICGRGIKGGVNLGIRRGFCDISATVLDYFNIENTIDGNSFLSQVLL